jgi:hypothetical protein
VKAYETRIYQTSEHDRAEFAALRQEIDSRLGRQHNLFMTQLTLAGAVFGFALASPGRSTVVLVVPFSSYLLCSRFVAQSHGMEQLAIYIREDLSGRVPGGLHWEQWRVDHSHRGALRWLSSHLIGFAGASLLAVAWTAGGVFSGRYHLVLQPGIVM